MCRVWLEKKKKIIKSMVEHMRVGVVALHTRCTKPVECIVFAKGAQSTQTVTLLTKASVTHHFACLYKYHTTLLTTGKPSLTQVGAPR
jgi:hypothetical protein